MCHLIGAILLVTAMSRACRLRGLYITLQFIGEMKHPFVCLPAASFWKLPEG